MIDETVSKETRLWSFDFVALFLTTYLMFFALDFMIPVLPFYIVGLGGSEGEVGVLMGLFTFCAVMFRPFQGRLVDREGRKKLLLAGVFLFVLSGIGLAYIPRLEALYLLRALQGVGWGAFLLSFNTLVIDLAPPLRRGEAVGFLGAAPPLAIASAPSVAEHLRASVDGFTYLFLVSAGVAAGAFLVATFIGEPPGDRREKLKGGKLFSRRVFFPSLMIYFITFSLGGVLTFLPLLGDERGIPRVGFFFFIFALSGIVSRPLSGRLSDRLGRLVAFIPGMISLVSSLLTIALAQSATALIAGGVLLGCGLGFTHPSLLALAADRLSHNERGVGMATFTAAFDLGIASGALVLGFLLNWLDFIHIFFICALVSSSSLVIFLARVVGKSKNLR